MDQSEAYNALSLFLGSILPLPPYAKLRPRSGRCCVAAPAEPRLKHGDFCLKKNALIENRLLPNEEIHCEMCR